MVNSGDCPYRLRHEIVAAARALFADKGYDHTTLSDITERLKVKEQAIYEFFRSKDDLLEAVWAER